LVEIPLEYFQTAIRTLQARPDIDGQRIAYTGGSRGGELSLLLGATFPEIRAVVAYVPSGYVWDGLAKKPEDLGKRAWTYQGKPITSVDWVEDPDVVKRSAELAEQGKPIPLTPGFQAAVRSASNLTEALIPVEKINGAVLLISGADDAMWPSATFADEVMDRLRAANFPHPYEHLRYPNAGHLILTPHVPTTVHASGHPLAKSFFAYGGTPKGGAFANADSWQRVLQFLDTHLKG
jgi:dienelactone hydrolase